MGKNLIIQARGKGSPRYRAISFRFIGKIQMPIVPEQTKGKITALLDCPGHSAPLIKINYENGAEALIPAPEGIAVGDEITQGITKGCYQILENIPEGTEIYNIESEPGDGGKFCRTAGSSARIVGKIKDYVIVKLPSKKDKMFNKDCRAIIGRIAGQGVKEKPLYKAGNAMRAAKARRKLYPKTTAAAMNAVDHPFGTSHTAQKAKNKPRGKFTPRGSRVGTLWPRRTGRKK